MSLPFVLDPLNFSGYEPFGILMLQYIPWELLLKILYQPAWRKSREGRWLQK